MENKTTRLTTERLSASWKNSQVLKDIDITIQRGQLTCITGPNGSGKSTLLTLISSTQEPGLSFHGNICFKDQHGTSIPASRKALPLMLSYLPQNEDSTWNYKGRDIIVMGRFPHTGGTGFYSRTDQETVQRTLESLEIEELSEKNILEMSGGEWQKIKIARCLAQDTPYILLDEPVANLDFTFQDQLLSLLKQTAHTTNRGILVSIHDINTASRFADSLILLPKLHPAIQGTPEEVLTEENLSLTYGGRHFGTFIHPRFGCTQVYPL